MVDTTPNMTATEMVTTPHQYVKRSDFFLSLSLPMNVVGVGSSASSQRS